MGRTQGLVQVAFVAVLVVAAPGCQRYRAYRVETGAADVVLRRVDIADSPAVGNDLSVTSADLKLTRTVESLRGARVRLRTPVRGDLDGDVVWTAGDSLGVRVRGAASAIEDPRGESFAISLADIETLHIADAKGEAATATAVIVGLAAAGLAAIAHGFASMAGN